jgi:hypothetical protein
MQRKIMVKKSDNGLFVSLKGERSYVKIFDAESGQLLRHSMSPEATDIQHVAQPGEYLVETDGTISALRSVHIDLTQDRG